MAFIEAFRSEFATISVDASRRFVRSVRSSVPFSSLEDVDRGIGDMIRTFDQIGREGRVLLNDLRAVQGRNDPAFEERMQQLRPRLYVGYRRVGILVRTSVGALHIRRMAQAEGMAQMISTDETELLDYLFKE